MVGSNRRAWLRNRKTSTVFEVASLATADEFNNAVPQPGGCIKRSGAVALELSEPLFPRCAFHLSLDSRARVFSMALAMTTPWVQGICVAARRAPAINRSLARCEVQCRRRVCFMLSLKRWTVKYPRRRTHHALLTWLASWRTVDRAGHPVLHFSLNGSNEIRDCYRYAETTGRGGTFRCGPRGRASAHNHRMPAARQHRSARIVAGAVGISG
jgi:hypothetical protein